MPVRRAKHRNGPKPESRVANWRKMFSLGEQDYGLDFREMLRPYQRAVVIDTGLVPIDEDRLRNNFV